MPLSLEIIAETARYLGRRHRHRDAHDRPERRAAGRGHDLRRQRDARWAGSSWSWIREEVGRRAFPVLARRTVIDFAALGGDAGYIGAAGMARLEYRKLTLEIS